MQGTTIQGTHGGDSSDPPREPIQQSEARFSISLSNCRRQTDNNHTDAIFCYQMQVIVKIEEDMKDEENMMLEFRVLCFCLHMWG